MHTEGLGDAADHLHGRILLPALDAAQIAHVHAHLGGKRLLTEALRFSEPLHVLTDDDLQPHAGMGARVSVNRLGTIVPNLPVTEDKHYRPYSGRENGMAAEFYCTACGSVGAPRTHNRGSSAIEILLLICGIIPGILYSAWRKGRVDRFCRACRAPNPIPVNTPLALRALGLQPTALASYATSASFHGPVSTVAMRKVGWELGLAIFIAPCIFGWALLRPGYSTTVRAFTAIWGVLVVPFVIGFIGAALEGMYPISTPATGSHSNLAMIAPYVIPLPEASLTYGALGKPNPHTSASDADLLKRSPQDILIEYRKRDRDEKDGALARSSLSGFVRDDEIAEYEDVQRVLFYNVAHRAPQLITPSDLKIVRADEQEIYDESCGDRGGAEAAYTLTAAQCEPYEISQKRGLKALADQGRAESARNKQWDTALDGNKITCGAASGQRWFIIWPDHDQTSLGERPVANNNPSDDAWQTYCGTGTIAGSW